MATQKDVAAHLDISTERFRQLSKRGIFPPSKGRGGYDVDACRVAYIRHLRGLASGQHDENPDALNLTAERARKERAQAEKTEFELAVARKEYVHVSHVEKALERFASAAAARFDSITSRLHQRFPKMSKRHLAAIKKEIADARNNVAGLRAVTD